MVAELGVEIMTALSGTQQVSHTWILQSYALTQAFPWEGPWLHYCR